MKFAWMFALSAFLFSGCAITRYSDAQPCSRENSLARGQKDAASGKNQEAAFLKSCGAETRAAAQVAYREGFENYRSKKAAGKSELAEEEAAELPVARAPANLSWICEVEANSKVFTGVGASQEEARGSAKASCGSHVQASYCEKADCKQAM